MTHTNETQTHEAMPSTADRIKAALGRHEDDGTGHCPTCWGDGGCGDIWSESPCWTAQVLTGHLNPGAIDLCTPVLSEEDRIEAALAGHEDEGGSCVTCLVSVFGCCDVEMAQAPCWTALVLTGQLVP